MKETEHNYPLPDMWAEIPQLMAISRVQHIGAAMLSELTSNHKSPVLFASRELYFAI